MNKNTQRMGRFCLPISDVQIHPELVRELFFGLELLVVEARFRYDKNAIEYLGLSQLFPETPSHTSAPEFQVCNSLEKFATPAGWGEKLVGFYLTTLPTDSDPGVRIIWPQPPTVPAVATHDPDEGKTIGYEA